MSLSRSVSIVAAMTWLCAAPAFADDVLVKVSLFPVGSFEVKSTAIEGKGTKKGGTFSATTIKVPVSSLKTGIALRDEHMQEKLNPKKKHPDILVEDIKAKGGTGTADITIAGTKKPVKFKYKDAGGDKATATFTLHLPDFNFEGISYKGVGVEDDAEVEATISYDGK